MRSDGFPGGDTPITAHLNADECAYVQVRFKWDIYEDPRIRDCIPYSRKGDPTTHTAIRVPVLQAWAGNGYGCQFIPREGMDVLIGFLGGQGERPVVLGCLYSQRNVLPQGANKYELQKDILHQRVGIVTKTRPTNGNWSEITLDDQQGDEVIKIRAAKDLDVEVLHDEMVHVGNDARVEVKNNAQIEVGNNRATHIGSNESLHVDGNRSTTVDGDASKEVGGDANVRVTGNVEATFDKDVTERVFGDKVMVVGSGEEGSKESAPSFEIYVDSGHTRSFSKARTEIVSEKEIVLSCKHSFLRMTKDQIILSSPKIMQRGGDVSMGGNQFSTDFKNAKVTADEVTVASGEASLKLASDATLQGRKVLLGDGGGEKETVDEEKDSVDIHASTMTLRVWAMDHERKRMPGAPYRLRINETVRTGVANEEGLIEEQDLNAYGECHLEWGTNASSDPHEGLREYRYESKLFIHLDSKTPMHVDHALHNLGYRSIDQEENLSAFEGDYGVPTSELGTVHEGGAKVSKTPKPRSSEGGDT